MKLDVPRDVIDRAKNCPYEFRCLETGQCGDLEKCSVSYYDGQDILFLKSRESVVCPYRLSFGGMQVCRCPVYYAVVTRRAGRQGG